MEANLNQFRLLTVRGEQEANNNRRSSCGRHLHPEYHDCTSSLAGGDSQGTGSNRSLNDGSVCVSITSRHDDDRRDAASDDSALLSTLRSPRRTARRGAIVPADATYVRLSFYLSLVISMPTFLCLFLQ